MPELQVNFEVFCTCGEGLCRNTEVHYDRHGNISIHVEPCEHCLEKARNEGAYRPGEGA